MNIFLRHAKPVDETQQTSSGSIWYLPHHGVVNPHKQGKVPVVFNPPARHKGTSLNEQLFKGPEFNRCTSPIQTSSGAHLRRHRKNVPSSTRSISSTIVPSFPVGKSGPSW
jgi:hypothetical protein